MAEIWKNIWNSEQKNYITETYLTEGNSCQMKCNKI
jgi:hypothetical protein